jgi:release factor glutamine methyltransferase
MGVDRAVIVSDPGRGVEPDAARRFMDFAARRREREPVAYILGSKGFRSIELAVDPRVLIPRPETEHLVEAVLDLPRGARICDVGTGSGAIALALKAERPDLDVVATDTSGEALEVARANAAALGLDVAFFEGDLLAGVPGRLDAVVSNPPYVEDGAQLAPEIVGFEPALALRAGPDGLDVIRLLLPAAGATSASVVALEIGAGQADAVRELTIEAGFESVSAVRDLAGIERVVVGRRRQQH